MNIIPVIPQTKNYWLIRTKAGKYYSEYRRKGFIGINWNEISLEDINSLTADELSAKVKEEFPDKLRPGKAASQLRTFVNSIKAGDTVVITGISSNKLSIGTVVDSEAYEEEITGEALSLDSKLCPYTKRKSVRWIQEFHKWDLDMPMFKLLQHAQSTISDANNYADVIESMIHNFYIRGDFAQLSLQVKREENIPWVSFFALGTEISDLAKEFNNFSEKYEIDMDSLVTKINVNSKGKIKLTGPVASIVIVGFILVSMTGGGVSVPLPEVMGGGSVDVQMNSLLREASDFLNHWQARENEELILNKYMNELDVETPEELQALIESVKVNKDPSGE